MREQLQIVSLPIGPKGKHVERALNVKLWDQLNHAHKMEIVAKSADRDSKKGTGKASGTRTKAEQKKRDDDRARWLEARIRGWRHEWLRLLIADQIVNKPHGTEEIVERMRVWLAAHPFAGNFSNLNVMDLPESTIKLAGAKPKSFCSACDVWPAIRDLDLSACFTLSCQLVIQILRTDDKDHNWPRLAFDQVDDLAVMAGIDLAAEWANLQDDRAAGRNDFFEVFLQHHDREQLAAQAAEWKIHAAEGTTKKELVAILLGQQRTLPLPKAIAALPKAKRAVAKRQK